MEMKKVIDMLSDENKKLKHEIELLKNRCFFLENIHCNHEDEKKILKDKIRELENENKRLSKNYFKHKIDDNENQRNVNNVNDYSKNENNKEIENKNSSIEEESINDDIFETDEFDKLFDEFENENNGNGFQNQEKSQTNKSYDKKVINKNKTMSIPEIISSIKNTKFEDVHNLVLQILVEPCKCLEKEKKRYIEILNTLIVIIETNPIDEPKFQNYLRFFVLFSKSLSPSAYKEYKERICETRDISSLLKMFGESDLLNDNT